MSRRVSDALRDTAVVAGTDLRRRVRNRSALVTAFVGPLALAVVFSLLIGGATSLSLRIGVVDTDGSPASQAVLAGLVGMEDPGDGAEGGELRFVAVADLVDARQQVDDGSLGAALVIPAGFGEVTAGGPAAGGAEAELAVLRSPERPIAGQVARSVALAIAGSVERVGLSVATAAATGAVPTDDLIAAAREAASPLAVTDAALGGRQFSAAAFFGASMSILFLFFTVGFAAHSVLADRESGLLSRVLSTPARPGAVIAGKTLSVAVLGIAGFVTVWTATTLLFGADWGEPLRVASLIVTTTFAIAGVSTFAVGLTRTQRQADTVIPAVAFILALVGGHFVGPGLSPPLLQRLAGFTPNGLALQSFVDLNAGAATGGALARTMVALVAFGVAFGAVGVMRVRRVATP